MSAAKFLPIAPRHVVRALAALSLVIGLLAIFAAPAMAQTFTLDLGATSATGPNSTTGRVVQLLLLMTVLSVKSLERLG